MAHVVSRKLLIAKIKIDRSFVKDMANNHNDAVSVRSTVGLGHNLGLKVVAEGVESRRSGIARMHWGVAMLRDTS